jgi:hypothetical protein
MGPPWRRLPAGSALGHALAGCGAAKPLLRSYPVFGQRVPKHVLRAVGAVSHPAHRFSEFRIHLLALASGPVAYLDEVFARVMAHGDSVRVEKFAPTRSHGADL